MKLKLVAVIPTRTSVWDQPSITKHASDVPHIDAATETSTTVAELICHGSVAGCLKPQDTPGILLGDKMGETLKGSEQLEAAKNCNTDTSKSCAESSTDLADSRQQVPESNRIHHRWVPRREHNLKDVLRQIKQSAVPPLIMIQPVTALLSLLQDHLLLSSSKSTVTCEVRMCESEQSLELGMAP
ncbi:MAG: hypothetical protein FRX49_09278 [Trebouxia sp. A1-2]|nr:MAG: hypothetical protein FRX49_09278 [Trebouxia sp. A1-2]